MDTTAKNKLSLHTVYQCIGWIVAHPRQMCLFLYLGLLPDKGHQETGSSSLFMCMCQRMSVQKSLLVVVQAAEVTTRYLTTF